MECKTMEFSVAVRGEVSAGRCKVMTKSGKDAEVVRWDGHAKYPVIAIVEGLGYNYTAEGVVQDGLPHGLDLVMVTSRMVMDGFEEALAYAFDCFVSGVGSSGAEFVSRFGSFIRKKACGCSMPSWRIAADGKCMSGDGDRYGFLVKGKEDSISENGLHLDWSCSPGEMYIPVAELLERLPVEKNDNDKD